MTNETTLTVVGNVVDTPRLRRTKSGHWVVNFRIASSTRRFDREKGEWTDASTLFVNVTAWRSLAEGVAESVVKGQPVIVTGRFFQRDYTTKDEKLRTSYELEATAVGHDLTRGVTNFQRVSRQVPTARVELDGDGIPADSSEHFYGSDAEAPAADVDCNTGEVRALTTVA